jgi:hypothetical protein
MLTVPIIAHSLLACWTLALRQAYDFHREAYMIPTICLRLDCGNPRVRACVGGGGGGTERARGDGAERCAELWRSRRLGQHSHQTATELSAASGTGRTLSLQM